jgi:hypothetical protein
VKKKERKKKGKHCGCESKYLDKTFLGVVDKVGGGLLSGDVQVLGRKELPLT